MATAKKIVAKKVAPKKVAKAKKVEALPQQFSMPKEVKDWIERASSIINHQKGEIARLKEDNAQLKAYRKFAEHRILRSEGE
jgi:hypothetical protein